MELLFERLTILRYEKVLKKRIAPTHFASDSRTLPRVTPQSRFQDVCTLSHWLLALLGEDPDKSDGQKDNSPIVVAQKILLAAEQVGVPGVAQLSAPALTSGVGIEVCELLDALTSAVVRGDEYCTVPPAYPTEPVETMESCDELDITDDGGQQNAGADGLGDSTTSLACEDDDVFSRWVVVKEDDLYAAHGEHADKEMAMIHSDIDPIAWENERRRILPKLQKALQDKLRRRPADSSWRVRLDQVHTHAGAIVTGQDGVRHEIAQLQAVGLLSAMQLLQSTRGSINH
jgi:hypothetical protein